MNRKKIFITTNGCPRRNLDSMRLSKYFKANHCTIVMSPEEANYILFVTCSFKQSKENESFKYIEKYLKYKGELIVLGCLPDIAPNKFKRKYKGKYLSTRTLEDIDKLFSSFKIKFKEIPDANRWYPVNFQ